MNNGKTGKKLRQKIPWKQKRRREPENDEQKQTFDLLCGWGKGVSSGKILQQLKEFWREGENWFRGDSTPAKGRLERCLR